MLPCTSRPSTRCFALPAARARSTVSLLVALLSALAMAPGLRAEEPSPAPTGSSSSSSSSEAKEDTAPSDQKLTERVTVTSTRLPDRESPRQDVPARVTILTRADIAASGARTLQELFAFQGLAVYDQVGNGLQQTFDMRGFTHGTGTALYLDGARINDPRNNAVALEAVPIDAVERIEIVPGSAAALAGGGSTAGVVMIETGPARDRSAAVTVAGGEWDAWRTSGSGNWTTGRLGVSATASKDSTDGFRENAEGDQKRFSARLDYDLGAGRSLSLTGIGGHSTFGQPGALTVDELSDDPEAAPFNQLDESDGRDALVTLNFHSPLPAGFSLAANASWRDESLDSLTTGRSAASFGGFALETDMSALGAAVQLSHESPTGRWSGAFGTEWSSGTTDAVGFFTPPTDLSQVDRANPASDNTADRDVLAFSIQESWKPVPSFTLTGGARWDRDETGYDARIPSDPSASRRFTETSLRAGAAWNPLQRAGFYASYGESFLPPTVEQMFSFPTFGSNPDLEPEDSRSIEAGARGTWGGGVASAEAAPSGGSGDGAGSAASGSWDLAVFRVTSRNEILFDPDSPLGLFGANVNAGRTRRAGIEGSARARLTRHLAGFLNATWTRAEFQNGPDSGRTVPLVPRERVAAGLQANLPAGVAFHLEGLRVGSQVLDNDTANAQERLDGYTVVNMRAAWSRDHWGRSVPASAPAGATREGSSLGTTLFVEVRNLFDRSYSTRGIYAFDFQTGQPADFFTPAPGRRVLGGLEVRFR